MRIVILGGGNIGMAIAYGILKSILTNCKIILTRLSDSFSDEEKSQFECTTDNKTAVAASNIVIIAVQPSQMDNLLLEIKDVLTSEHIVISVVSGVIINRIKEFVGEIPIARAMPNIAIKVRASMTCLAFNSVGKEYRSIVEDIFNSVGKTLVIPEYLFAIATVLCGSGTALVLKFIRAFMQAGIQNGFKETDALTVAIQVVKGAAMLLEDGYRHPEAEIDKVTTPGGCTIDALIEMEHAGFSSALLKAIGAGIKKALKLYS